MGRPAPSRCARLDRALAGTQVAGTVTNLAFLGALTRHKGFAAGDVDTGLIGRDLDRLVVEPPTPELRHKVAAGMAALGVLEGDWMTAALPCGNHWRARSRWPGRASRSR